MKILCADSPRGEDFFVKPDTALLRPGTAFYAPDWGAVESVEGVAVKVERPVKCLEQKFAHRAWNEWCAATEHRIADIDPQKGRAFDRSFFVSEAYEGKNTLSEAQIELIDATISNISNYLTIRIGDLVFIPGEWLK